MNRTFVTNALALAISPVFSTMATLCTAADDFHPAQFELIFSDEFSGSSLDRGKWCTRYIYGGGAAPQVPDAECQQNGEGTLDFLNDEQQRYVDYNRNGETMHVVEGGVLSLRTTKTRTEDSWASYESAMVRAKKKDAFQAPSGNVALYYTARVKLPDVVGTWPAFWLAPDRDASGATTWPPEIDIFEGALNGVDDTKYMLHQAGIIQGNQTSTGDRNYTYVAPEFETTWNNYHSDTSLREKWVEVALLWTENEACYFIDGYKTACEEYRWVANNGQQPGPPQLLLNLAIGGGWAGRYGIDDAKFPTMMKVDHVRVYAGNPNDDTPPPRTGIEVCGRPVFNPKTDQGVFIWQDCNNKAWKLKVTAGGDASGINYVGEINSSEGFTKVKAVGLENRDLLIEYDSRLDFNLKVWNRGLDGLSVHLPASSSTCFSSTSSADNGVYLGPNKVRMDAAFDLNSLDLCD